MDNLKNNIKLILICFTITGISCNTIRPQEQIDTQLLCSALGTTEVLKYLHLNYETDEDMVVYTTADYFKNNIKKCNDLFPTIYIDKYTELPRRDDRKNHIYITKLIEKNGIFDIEIYYFFQGVIFNIKMQTFDGRTYVAKEIDVKMF